MKLAYAEAFGTELGTYGKAPTMSLTDILRYVKGDSKSTFKKFIGKLIATEYQIIQPDVIGISLLTENQLTASLQLAVILKKHFPQAYIYLGGSYITSIYNKLVNNRELYSIINGFFVGEGETSFLSLLKKIENNEPLEGIPNFINNINTSLSFRYVENINDLPEPDFDGLDLSQYTRSNAISYYTSKGCTWGRCTFCSVREVGEYREKNINTVLEEIRKLHLKYAFSYITFTDDILSDQRMKIIASFILSENHDIKWDCQTRFSKNFTEDFCRLLKKSNNAFVAFGFESVNERILKHIKKGISLRTADYVLSNFSRAGLKAILNFMIAFPTETREEASETLNFSENLQFRYPNMRYEFNTQLTRIERNSDFAKDAEKYGVKLLKEMSLVPQLSG